MLTAEGDPSPHFTHQQIMRVLSGILLCIFPERRSTRRW